MMASNVFFAISNDLIICRIPIDMNLYESEYSVTDEELVKLLAENPNVILPSSGSKNKKKKKKSSSGGAAASTDKQNDNQMDTAAKAE